jgi:hypothetical protein
VSAASKRALTARELRCTLHNVTRSLPKLFVVALAFAAVLGHICVLPTHAHAASAPAATAHHETADDHGADESLHGASCDAAVSTAGNVPLPVSVIVDRLLDSRASYLQLRAVTFDAALRSESPPLFLLHAALLI